jgi:hypothetical protein
MSQSPDLGPRERQSGLSVGVLGCWGRADLRLPTSSGAEEARRDGQEAQEGKDLSLDQYPPLTAQLAPELITFSTVPAPRWQASTSLPSSSCICLLALVRVYLSTPPYHSLGWQTACEGARVCKHCEGARVCKQLLASASICKRPASALARGHSSAHRSLAGL